MKRGKRIGRTLFVFEEIESDAAEVNSTVAHSTTQRTTQQTTQCEDMSTESDSSSDSDSEPRPKKLTELNIALLNREMLSIQPRSAVEHPTAYKVEHWLQHNNVTDKLTERNLMINHTNIHELGHYVDEEENVKNWLDSVKPVNINNNSGGRQC